MSRAPQTPATTPKPAAQLAQRWALGILVALATAELALLMGPILRDEPPQPAPQPAAKPGSKPVAGPIAEPIAKAPDRPVAKPAPGGHPIAAGKAKSLDQPPATEPKAAVKTANPAISTAPSVEAKSASPPPSPAIPALAAPPQPFRIRPPAIGQWAASPTTPSAAANALTKPALRQGPPPIGSFVLPAQPNLVAHPPNAVLPATPTATGNLPSPPRPAPRPGSSSPTPTKTATPKASPADQDLEALLMRARKLSGQGDMQGCLDELKRAQALYPSKPQLLAELARTYETMGLGDKANATWKQLAALPAAQAGSFLELAQRKIGESIGLGAGQPSSGSRLLSLGACSASAPQQNLAGQRVELTLPLLRRGNAQIDPSKVDLDVLFFERVNGEKIAQSIGDKPETHWQQEPVDWTQSGEEVLAVNYFLPAMTADEISAHGRRTYHGFVVRLYYDNRLQDSVAQPADLLQLLTPAQPSHAPDTGLNPLLPPPSNSLEQ